MNLALTGPAMDPPAGGSTRGIEDRADARAASVLSLRGLVKRYGSKTALDGLSFEVAKGQMFGFVGPNGAGKTTTMRTILGLLAPDEGEVLWRGLPADAGARKRFGYMPEERGLYPKMRVGDQLSYMARLHGLAAREAKDAAARWMGRLGVAEHANDRVEKLSLGNQQRVQLAAALVHDPDLLVLDEPFSGLDPVGVDTLSEVLLERAAQGAAVVFSSHQLELVERLCDAVAIIDHGSLVAQGTVEELRRFSGSDRMLRVCVEDGGSETAPWEGLGGVRVVSWGASGVLLSLAEGGDEQAVLDLARRTGRVTHFGFERRSLADVFREVLER